MTFFTSDSHFWHSNIIQYCNRPFDTVEQMNEMLIKYWNDTVGPEDTVYVLGDFSLAHRPVETILPRLNGIKHLIAGNHDHCHPLHYKKKEEKGERMRKLYLDSGFKTIKLEDTIEIAGQLVKMHHMPYRHDHTKDERYANWRPKDEGGWLLHGHVHELWLKKDKQINVGVDVWDFRPVPITEIEKIIKG